MSQSCFGKMSFGKMKLGGGKEGVATRVSGQISLPASFGVSFSEDVTAVDAATLAAKLGISVQAAAAIQDSLSVGVSLGLTMEAGRLFDDSLALEANFGVSLTATVQTIDRSSALRKFHVAPENRTFRV
jgi:hypothetical protein